MARLKFKGIKIVCVEAFQELLRSAERFLCRYRRINESTGRMPHQQKIVYLNCYPGNLWAEVIQ